MQISQIYLSDVSDELPPALQRRVDSVRRRHANLSHTIYNAGPLRNFLAANFEAGVVDAYDMLNPFAYKADLAKYCLLYKLGGWYFDIAVSVLNPVPVRQDTVSLAYRDRQIHSKTSWAVSTGILFSRPGNPVFRDAIDAVVRNCAEKYYGITPLCPTGPTLLGRSFAKCGADSHAIFGDVISLTPTHKKQNTAYVLSDGTIHAFTKNGAGGDLESLGAKGTNNYNEFYRAGNVYNRRSA